MSRAFSLTWQQPCNLIGTKGSVKVRKILTRTGLVLDTNIWLPFQSYFWDTDMPAENTLYNKWVLSYAVKAKSMQGRNSWASYSLSIETLFETSERQHDSFIIFRLKSNKQRFGFLGKDVIQKCLVDNAGHENPSEGSKLSLPFIVRSRVNKGPLMISDRCLKQIDKQWTFEETK